MKKEEYVEVCNDKKSIFPGDWKQGNIAPIFKKGRKEDPGNY